MNGDGHLVSFRASGPEFYGLVWKRLLSGQSPMLVAADIGPQATRRLLKGALRFGRKTGDGGPLDLATREIVLSLLERRAPYFLPEQLDAITAEVKLYDLPLAEAHTLVVERSPELARFEEDLAVGDAVQPSWPDPLGEGGSMPEAIRQQPQLELAGRMHTFRDLLRSIVGPEAQTDDPVVKSRTALQVVARFLAEPGD